ncbi:MAG: LytTR family DNA-binding domain-containing protein [Lachnospiraceae bacterium]|nr:LytTR family DNA-binding domain-containing protein [Lachnospiraceae bacterium]
MVPPEHFDIIFLDIQMTGINGIDTARAVRAMDEEAVLIFITAVKEYVFEAFDVAAFHYLVKPLEEQKFSEVFLRAASEVQKRQNAAEEMLVVKAGKSSIAVQKNSIYYVENKAKKLEIRTDKRVIEIYAVMSGIEQELGAGFYRCHRGYLVNMAHIAEYDKNSITLTNGETIYLAKEKYSAFVKTYMRYLRNGVYGSV